MILLAVWLIVTVTLIHPIRKYAFPSYPDLYSRLLSWGLAVALGLSWPVMLFMAVRKVFLKAILNDT